MDVIINRIMDNLQTNIKKLLTLTEAYELSNIRTLLDLAPTDQKGDLFEEYLAELYKGNGWLAQVTGEKGDAGADLILRHPETPEKVSIVIQAKNHKLPLTFDNTKIELIKFEEQAKKNISVIHILLSVSMGMSKKHSS